MRQDNEGEDFDLTPRLCLCNAYNGHILGDTDNNRKWAVSMDDGGVPGGMHT